jgi:uncharacterized protein YjeT (DUF2065 family)
MTDFLVAIGLVLAIEGVAFAGFPAAARKASAAVAATPETTLRTIGVVFATLGVFIVWLVRG